ncbi:MAG: DUF5060 domain-containing protein [Candidatus Theseobacter exili]|nr:DUF5060 domain-containing protein [Candidatus Theseobacter exili]
MKLFKVVIVVAVVLINQSIIAETNIIDERANSKKIEQYDKFELTFSLGKEYKDPFDKQIVHVQGHFLSPSNKETVADGFYYQDYRHHLYGSTEIISQVGTPEWKIRFTPKETGKYKYWITLKDREGTTKTSERTFEVINGTNPGFISICPTDRNYFEFSNGEFYYPIGHNIRYPAGGQGGKGFDFSLQFQKGTFIYLDYLQKMSLNGENWMAIWFSTDWMNLEWKNGFQDYKGLGKYNLENAWKLDEILHKAHERNIYINLFLNHHGEFLKKTESTPDGVWHDSPYNIENGGFLKEPEELYTDNRAKTWQKQKLDYILARWGYSINIMQWTIISEIDLTQLYYDALHGDFMSEVEDIQEVKPVIDWLEEMAQYIKKHDPNKHLISANFAYYRHGMEVWANTPTLDIVQSNCFTNDTEDDPEKIISTYTELMKNFNMPYLPAEYGGHWSYNTDDTLETFLHCSLWLMFMSNMSGATGFWWWSWIDAKNMYWHYKALADFIIFDDKRNQNFKPFKKVIPKTNGKLRAIGIKGKDIIYIWIYNKKVLETQKKIKTISAGKVLELKNVKDGKYLVEVWDTYEGEKIAAKKVSAIGGKLNLGLPKVRKDIALKIKRLN